MKLNLRVVSMACCFFAPPCFLTLSCMFCFCASWSAFVVSVWSLLAVTISWTLSVLPLPLHSVEDECSRFFFLVLISLLFVSGVTFWARKSRGFFVPTRLSRGRSIGSPFMHRCWTQIESWLLNLRTALTWIVIILDCSTID